MSDKAPDLPPLDIPDVNLDGLRVEPGVDLSGAAAAAPAAAESRPSRSADTLGEIAEDMLDVIQRLGRLERNLQETMASVVALRDAFAEHSNYQYRLADRVRSDVAGERRGLALRAVFEPMAHALDQLEAICKGFDPIEQQAAYGQTSAAAATLANLLQSLGFTGFVPSVGDEFDATRMQCLGYVAGERGIVLQVLKAGYMAGDSLVRPAGVLMADPEQSGGPEPVKS